MPATKPEVEPGSWNNFWAETDSVAIPTATPTFSTMPNPNMILSTLSDIARHRLMSATQMSATKPEVETGSGINFWTETDSEAIITATPTSSTMPNPNMTLATLSDITRHRLMSATQMPATKPEVEITFERKQMAKRF